MLRAPLARGLWNSTNQACFFAIKQHEPPRKSFTNEGSLASRSFLPKPWTMARTSRLAIVFVQQLLTDDRFHSFFFRCFTRTRRCLRKSWIASACSLIKCFRLLNQSFTL